MTRAWDSAAERARAKASLAGLRFFSCRDRVYEITRDHAGNQRVSLVRSLASPDAAREIAAALNLVELEERERCAAHVARRSEVFREHAAACSEQPANDQYVAVYLECEEIERAIRSGEPVPNE